MEVNPILVSVPQAAEMIGRGVSTVYELIGDGRVKAVKSDVRTLVVVASLYEYADSLPEAKVAPPRRRKPPRDRSPLIGHNNPPPNQRMT